MCLHIFVDPDCGTHKRRRHMWCSYYVLKHMIVNLFVSLTNNSNGVWSNKFVSARNVQATLCRVLSISFVETQLSRTALRGFVQFLLGRSGLVWLVSGFLVGSLVWTVSGSRCSSASRFSWVGAGSGGGGRLRSSSMSVCRRLV